MGGYNSCGDTNNELRGSSCFPAKNGDEKGDMELTSGVDLLCWFRSLEVMA